MDQYSTAFRAKEYTSWFSWIWLLALIMGLFVFFWLIKAQLYETVKEKGFSMAIKDNVFIIMFAVTILLSCMTLALVYSGFSEVINGHRRYEDYVNGNCEYIEGYIENFHPMPEELHDTEHFTVNDVGFSYGADNSDYYYSRCQKDGGFLREGMYVRMWYINVDVGSDYPDSYIMQIDVKY